MNPDLSPFPPDEDEIFFDAPPVLQPPPRQRAPVNGNGASHEIVEPLGFVGDSDDEPFAQPARMMQRRKNSPARVQRGGDPVVEVGREGVLASHSAEQMVLGACLIDPDAIATARNFLKPEDFHRADHRAVFASMCDLADKGQPCADLTIVADHLVLTGRIVIDEVYGLLAGITAACATAMFVDTYARIVQTYAFRRRILAAGGKIGEIAYLSGDETDVAGLASEVERVLHGLMADTSTQDTIHIKDALGDVIAQAEIMGDDAKREQHCRATGYGNLDRVLSGGLYRGSLITLAARPAMGKTGLALNMACNVANAGGNVLFFSLEMSAAELTMRLLSLVTGIPSDMIKTGQLDETLWTELLKGCNQVAQLPFYINDSANLPVHDLRTKTKRFAATHPIDLVVVDYLGLMVGGRAGRSDENRVQEVSYISRNLKLLARELNVPVLALSQLSRSVEGRTDKRPMLSDLRDSGSIEQDSDVVMFIYRDDYYNADSDRSNIADVIVAKHRQGSIGTESFFFHKSLVKFSELELRAAPNDGFARPPAY